MDQPYTFKMPPEEFVFYSFEKISHELNLKRTFNSSTFGNMSELEWLCRTYFHQHEVREPQHVEWKRFGITPDKLLSIYKWIDDPEESFHVFIYFRDYPQSVVDDIYMSSTIDAISIFSNKCCEWAARIYNSHKSLQHRMTIDGDCFPDLEAIGGAKPKDELIGNMPKYPIGMFRYQMMAHRLYGRQIFYLYDKILVNHLKQLYPKTPAHFQDDTILYAVFYLRSNMKQFMVKYMMPPFDDSKKKQLESVINCQSTIKEAKISLTRQENRRLFLNKEPVIKTIFGLCAYFAIDDFTLAERSYINTLCADMREYLIKNYGEHAIDILEKCIEEFKEKERIRIEEEQANAAALKTRQAERNIKDDRDLRIERLKEVKEQLKADPNIAFKGDSPTEWFYIYYMMVYYGIYEEHDYKQFRKDLKEIGIDADKWRACVFSDNYKRVIEKDESGQRPPICMFKKGTRKATIDNCTKISETARSILFRKD